MKSYDILLLANRNLWRRKGRTVLTVLGVIIGTASIVVMLSLGIGIVEAQKQTMARWGSLNIIRVNQAYSYPGMPEEEMRKKLNDAAIGEIRGLPGVVAVSPVYETWGDVRWGKKRGGISLVGIEPGMMDLLEFSLLEGRLLNADDRFNVVAGSMVINNFWDEKQATRGHYTEYQPGDPLELLNQRLTMTVFSGNQQKRTYNLNVVGVLDEKSMDYAWSVYGPISEIKKIRDFMNQGRNNQPDYFFYDEPVKQVVTSVTPARKEKEEDQYNYALVRTKDVSDSRKLLNELRDQGYMAYGMADHLEGVEQMARRMQAVLGGIGAITLLVAAIGITNTMVMSIYERTREIAIIKVIGASFRDIRWLFLTESSLIGLLGGTLGIGLSFTLSFFLNKYGAAFMNPQGGMMGPAAMQISMIPPWLVGFALLFSLGIGLVSGVYPANRAIHLDPITAMRH